MVRNYSILCLLKWDMQLKNPDENIYEDSIATPDSYFHPTGGGSPLLGVYGWNLRERWG